MRSSSGNVTAAPLVGQLLSDLSAAVTEFMAAHDHVNRDFAVVETSAADAAVA